MTATHEPSFEFRRHIDMIGKRLLIKPLLDQYLFQGQFPNEFKVTFKKHGEPRRPDDYFHPSTHPTWPERMLYYYLAEPDKMLPEELTYGNWMAITMGSAAGDFIATCLIDAGVLTKPTGTCEACGRTHGRGKGQCPEWGALDPVLKRRGHMDGLVAEHVDGETILFEMKTTGEKSVIGVRDNDLDWLKEKHFDYYSQVQEYMDIKGLKRAIIVFVIMGFPWKTIEIQIDRDLAHIAGVKAKYERVRRAVSTGILPDPCCAPKSKQAKGCPARMICPIGRVT